jgi:hypothetical protein
LQDFAEKEVAGLNALFDLRWRVHEQVHRERSINGNPYPSGLPVVRSSMWHDDEEIYV